VPPGQFVTEKFPILTFGQIPTIDKSEWNIKIFGLVRKNIYLKWNEIMNLKQISVEAEFHCVTQWSRLVNKWDGVQFKSIIDFVDIQEKTQYVMIHCYGGYTTNLPLDVLLDDDVIFARRHDGRDLSPAHGGPLRLIVPQRYGWKSAKWVNGIEFMADNRAGFWESRGYHMDGDPWKEQRFK
jgi:DMSO/TMAO reductase YedYZ molybdopterin-dependent catalytic subunit